jgi:phenylpyruvate tautomerase PptA (4-oxalocrotonate tautomerase family)
MAEEENNEVNLVINKQIIKVMRELYLHNIIKRVGCDEGIKDLNEILFTKFQFNDIFMSSMVYEKPFGSFIYDILSKSFITEPTDSSDYRESKEILCFVHSIDYLNRTSRINPTMMPKLQIKVWKENNAGAENELNTSATIVDDISETNSEELQLMKSKTDVTIASPEVNNVRTYDRLDCSIAVDIQRFCGLLADKFSKLSTITASSKEELLFPWFHPEKSTINMEVLRSFATMVLSTLTQYPGSSLEQIQSKLMCISLDHLEALMNLLISVGLVKKVVTSVARKLRNVFDSFQIWNKNFSENKNESQHKVFYEIENSCT